MASNLPLVSIIIPYIEDRGWLSEAIKSIENQSYPTELIEVLLEKSPNSVGHNINNGIRKATGKYIKYFAEDDYLEPNCIADCVDFLESTPYRWMHANSHIIYQDGERKGRRPVHVPPFNPTKEQLLDFCHIHGGTVMYEADLIKCFAFDESLWTGEEYDLYLQLYSAGHEPGYLNKFVFNYRRHSGQKSLRNLAISYQEQRRYAHEQIRKRYRS